MTPPEIPGATLLGLIVEKRYSLDARLDTGDEARTLSTWRATDTVLARPVVVRIAPGTRAGTKLVHAAADLGSLRQPSLAPVLDTVREPSRAIRGVVREWVEALPLINVLAGAGLRREEAVTLIRLVAEAIATLHEAELAHGHLSPSNIFIRPDGRIAVTDAGLRVSQVPRLPPLPERQAQDLLAISDLIHLVLSGTWPGQPDDAPGVAATPRDVNGPLSPRQIRAGVPRELDAVWARAAHAVNAVAAAPFRTVAELVAVVRELPSAPLGSLPPVVEPTHSVDLRWTHTRWGKRVRKSVPWLALLSIGIVGWVLGLTIGALPGQNHTGSVTGTGAEIGLSAEAKPLHVKDFDPPPGDGVEDTDAVKLAHDGDTSTSWVTDTYKGSARLGGIKPGVGLLVDLGTAASIKTVTLTLPLAGSSVEIRSADSPASRASDYVLQASALNARTQVTMHPTDASPHRYWLIWLTSLAKVPDGFRGGISEFAFLR